MLPGLHVAVFFFSALLTVGSGDEVSVDLCKLPDGVFPDPDSCKDFIRCQSGVPDVEPCPDNLLFNPLKLTCDFSKTGNCSEPEDFDETSTPVETNDVVCSEEGPNVYPIQSSCTEYYMCDNDTAFKVKCPKDLLMNADKLTCDYPENVDCDSVSSPEESTVGMKAVYEDDDKDLESETKTSVTFSSIDTSSPSAEPAVQIKSETDFDSKEMTGYTLNEPEETTFAKLDATGNVISDKSVSPNPEITSTYGYLDENITSKNSTLKETARPKEEDSSFEVKPTQTNSDQDITGKTSVFTSTSNVNDEVISSTSDAHRERSNLEDSTTENNAIDILTSPDPTVIDLSSNTFHDFTSSESSEQSLGDKSVTAIQTPDDKGINDTGSGSDIDIINIFTTDSNNASQQLDVSTNNISTSNSLISTVTNVHNLNTKASSSDKSISDSLSGTLENVSTLDSEVDFTTKVTDLEKSEGTGTETTKSEVSLSASYELTSQTDVADNKASVDNLTSVVKSTETIVTDSNFNESTTRSSVLTSLGSLEDIKNESYFQDTTKIPTVVEADKIAPEKTLTTNPSLMSSDPLTDNETTKITTSTFSETAKVTPKYMTNTATTEEHPSFDAETSEGTSLSDNQTEEYEVFTESVVESNWTLTPESNFFTELSTVGLERIVSSQPAETSIVSDVNTEILDTNDITSEDTISNKQSSLSNEVSTSSLLQHNSDSTSNSHFINEVINTEAITSSENISSGHISENVVVETHDYISSETTSPVSTEMDNLTESVINVEIVMSHSTDLTSENQNPTLTSTHLKLTGDDLIIASHLPTRQNTKVTEITSVETSDMLYSTSNSTEHPTTTNAFSSSTNSGGNDIDLKLSSLKTQQPDETTEKIDLSSESDVTKVDQTYIDMYTNNSTSSFENSSDESFAASTADLESVTYNSSSSDTSENLKLGSSEVAISSVSESFQSTHTESSSDLTSTLLHTRTEVSDINVTNEQTSEDDFDSSKSTSKNTRINSKETELPYKIQSSTLSEVLTNFSGSDVVTSTKESLSSDLMTSLHHQSEQSTQISETGMDFGGITLSTSGVTDPENILTTENKGTSTDVSRDTLNDATTTVFIQTSSNTIAGNASETILSSTGQIDDSTPTSLPKNTEIFEITSDSLGPGSVTRPGATLTSSEITENLKLVSTDPYTLQNNSTESTTEINKTPNVSKETSKAFVSNSTVSNTVIDVGTTSFIENITNMYKESSTLDATDPFKNTSVVTVSSLIEVTNETSESFWPETKEIATENNRTSILHASTTIMGLISDTIQSTISEVTSVPSTTDMDGETTSSDISSSAVSYSKDSFASTSAIATKQNYISTLSTLQIATSEDSTPDSSNSTHMILPITYFNDSDNSISTIDKASESPEYDSNNVTETSTSVITSTKASYSSDENTSLENVKSTKETPVVQVTTEFISTKLNSEAPDTYETSQFTGSRFEESSPNSQTNFDIVSRNTLSTEWPTKSSTDIQSIPSDSISSDESTSDITSSDVMTESTFKTSDTSTKTTTYKGTSEPETVSKNNTFPSPGNLVSSTDILFEGTSLSSLKVTSETTSKTITETSRDITDGNIFSTSSNISINSSEIDSSTVDPTNISESTDLFTDSKRETVPTTAETDGGLSTKDETESTDSIIKIQSTSIATSKFATEISRESTIDTTSFSRIIATETGNPFPITATTRDTTKENNLINDRTTETTPKTSNTDSISIYSKTLPDDKGETDSSTEDPTKISESTDIFTDSKRETVPTRVETDGGLSSKDETESTDSIIKILSTSTSTSKFATEISGESTVHTTSFSRIIATETGNPFPITATTRDTTKENNLINDRTTETYPKTSNTDSISIASKTLPEDKGETDYIFSTTDSSVVKTTVMKTSSKDISESDLQPMSTTEMSVLINDTDERLTESNTDFTSVSMASRNLEEETNSVEYSSTTYFPSDLRTETSHLSPNTDIERENKEIYSTDMSSSGTTVTKTHSKGISESDLPVVPTTETTLLIFNDTNKTTTESITDVSNVSITSRNIIGKTESTEDPSTTYIPAAFRTETSISSANTDTESEFQRISSTDILSESTTAVNPICVTSEGSFPYPDDCNKFYRCTKGVPVQSSCVGNEHFDPVKRICTNPCLAKCDPNADCGTTESNTSAEESTSSQTMLSKDISSTSELYNTGTEEISLATASDYFIEDTTTNKISKSTSEVTSTITNSAFRSSILESTTEKLGTDYFTSDEASVADNNATKDLTEISSDDYMSSRSFENVTSDDSSPISSDVPIPSTTVTYEITPETRTEVIEVSSSTVTTSTETSSSGSSEFTVTTDITPESSGDGEDSSSTSTLITSTKCENGDCLSSKSATSATLVPFRLCHRNDFLPQPKCSEYLDCTGKEPKKLECPNGLHFNPSKRVCDWPYSAECGTSPKPLYEPTDLLKCPCKSCLIPSTKSCSHYYLCIGFTAYEMKCSNSLYFDRSRNTCNYAPLVDCSHLTSTSTTTEIEPTESSTKTSTVEISTSTKASTTPASFVCPSQEGLFRYPGNCGMFYQCANWYPFVMNCAATTHFSEITQRCEYPCDAKCDLTLNCGISSTAPPSDPRCSCNNCRLPSPDSCTKYITCVNGRARIEYCPWGKTFDARRSTCDWAHKVTCHPSAMCPERNGLFSHKDDCHKFVHCSNGIPYVKKCPSILEFDPIKKRCEWPNGRCNYLPINTRDVDYKNVEHRKGWKCPKIFGYYPVDQHCNKFYYCSFGTPTLKECSPGLLYNPRYQTCDWKKQVRCNSNRHLKPRKCRAFDHHIVCSEDRRPKLHVLCNMYYDCTAGRACAKQCPVGLYFNNVTGVCDLPENVKCLNRGEGDYSLKELSVKCASGEHGRQVNPTNDSCFYHCRQGKVVSGCCSKGHVYNLHKDKCERRTKSLRI